MNDFNIRHSILSTKSLPVVGYSSDELTMTLKDAMFHIYETDPDDVEDLDADAEKIAVSPKKQ